VVETHIHKETGSLYQLLFYTNIGSTRENFPETAVYISSTGWLLSRPLVEFNEKFEEIK